MTNPMESHSIYAVSNDGGDYLYLTSNCTTAEMARSEGYIVEEVPFFGDLNCTAAKALYREDTLVGAINEDLPTLRFAIAVNADGTGFISVK